MNENSNVYTVKQVNAYIKNMFAQDFVMNRICVAGEVSNCKYHSSGHIYFTLKDDSGVLQAVMFSSSRRTGLKFDMKAGDRVNVFGSIRVYDRGGTYQLYTERILPQGTGLLYQRYEELKKKLGDMGMFDASYKREIPAYASRIGVVTASTGAAVQDIRTVAHRRNPFVQLILYPARVQGEGAAESVACGIRTLEDRGVDLIIVGRGGGSIEDLWAFNEEIVARAVFDCSVPVISAVGHETDFTIADFVADRRAPTPSAAAELAVYDIRQTIEKTENIRYTLNREFMGRLDRARDAAEKYRLRLKMQSPGQRLKDNRQRADEVRDRLTGRMERIFSQKKQKLQLEAAALDAKSPLKKLESGYAFVAGEDGRRIPGAKGLKSGDRVRAYLKDGSFTAVVDEVIPERARDEI